MRDIGKYQGVIPAFYACYDAEGNICTERTKQWTKKMVELGVKGRCPVDTCLRSGGEIMGREYVVNAVKKNYPGC